MKGQSTSIKRKLPGVWKTYDNSSGLLAGVGSIDQDADGYLWLGTFGGGLGRYDGVEFVHYTTADGLLDNRVRAVEIDREGCIWFRLWTNALYAFDRVKFRLFTMPDGSPCSALSLTKDAEGVVWFCTPEGNIYHQEAGTVVPYLSQADPLTGEGYLFRDSRQRFWIGTRHGLRCYADHRYCRTLTTRDGLINDHVRAFCEDRQGRLWFGTEAGVSCYDGETFTNYTTETGLSHNEIWGLYCDAQGRVWISTFGGGVTCYDEPAFFSYDPSDGLLENAVTEIIEDREGNYWFCHTTTGLSRFAPHFFEVITPDPVAEGGFTQDPEGRLWYGSFYTLGCVEDGHITTRKLSGQVMAVLSDRQGGLWVGTWGNGISHYSDRNRLSEPPRHLTQEDGLTDLYVPALMEDRAGSLWAGLNNGDVCRYDGDRFHAVFHGPFGINALLEDRQGRIWSGCWMGGGLRCWQNGTLRVYTQEDGLPSDAIRWLLESRDGTLWICTLGGGIARYDGQRFTSYSFAEGMWNAMASFAYEDRDGHLWFGTEGGGVQRYDGKNFQVLTRHDGLLSSTVTSITQQADGAIVFATKRGIARYPLMNGAPPPVFVRRVIADQVYPQPAHIDLTTATSDRVVFQFRGISFRTNRIRYNYRLEGYDEEWQATWNEHAVYEHLPPGEYRFQVVAINRDLVYSQTPAAVTVSVQPDPRDERITVLQSEVERLRREVSRKYHFDHIIGKSQAMQEVYGLMEKAIDAGLTVMIAGETGTGKELVAKAIHYHSSRRHKPLQELNCGAIPKELVAATLFGYRKGAFTGAYEDTPGLFEAAEGGTILLDEIGEMSGEAQVHLLRVLQEQTIQRVGETRLRHVDVRIIAATNRDLEAEVRKGKFREDLYYRLSVFPITLPSLRSRIEDIPLLVDHFLKNAGERFGKKIDGVAPGVIEMLQRYSWPGNVRELENEVYRAAALVEEGAHLLKHHFSSRILQEESLIQEMANEQEGYTEAVNRFRKQYIEHILRDCGGNRSEAAKRLKMYRPNLIALMKKLGIEE